LTNIICRGTSPHNQAFLCSLLLSLHRAAALALFFVAPLSQRCTSAFVAATPEGARERSPLCCS